MHTYNENYNENHNERRLTMNTVAITKDTLTEQLKRGEVEITYNKQSDGNNAHTIVGTLTQEAISKYAPGTKIDTSSDSDGDDIVRFVAPSRSAWRSVRVSSILGVKSVE